MKYRRNKIIKDYGRAYRRKHAYGNFDPPEANMSDWENSCMDLARMLHEEFPEISVNKIYDIVFEQMAQVKKRVKGQVGMKKHPMHEREWTPEDYEAIGFPMSKEEEEAWNRKEEEEAERRKQERANT